MTYQIATALQLTIASLLDPAYTLVGVVLLCMYTEFAARVLGVDVSIARRVLLAQLGLSLMGAVDYALVQAAATRHASFLLRTYSLCLPSVLGSISPVMLSNDYVQNAISSYVYRYAQNSQEMGRVLSCNHVRNLWKRGPSQRHGYARVLPSHRTGSRVRGGDSDG